MVVLTMGGPPGAGKSDVSKLLAKRLNLKYYSVGMFFREKAKEAGVEFNEFLKTAPEGLHLEADKHCDDVSKQGNVIIDGRLAAYMAKTVNFKIFLTAPLEIRGTRVAQRNQVPVSEATAKIKERYALVIKDIKNIYDIDIRDLKIYDVVLNTEFFGLNDVVDVLEKVVRTGMKL